jgi:hypothetical protein
MFSRHEGSHIFILIESSSPIQIPIPKSEVHSLNLNSFSDLWMKVTAIPQGFTSDSSSQMEKVYITPLNYEGWTT